MKAAPTAIAVLALLAPHAFPAPTTGHRGPPQIAAADGLFQAGKFTEAREIYARLADREPADYAAILQLGRIALLSNHLDEARKWLGRAIALRPGGVDAKVMLAEVFYREDDFQKAAAALTGVNVSGEKLIVDQYPTLNVAKLKSFKGQTPYELSGPGEITRLPFVRTDPLPVVEVRVNGGEKVTFFIDTGGSELTLDTDFAREVGSPRFGAVQGTFSGGQNAEVQLGRIESLTLGDWTIRNVPVAMLPLRQLSTGLGVKRIDGIIGTTLLYHFLATLDYPHGELVLRRKTPANLRRFILGSPDRRVEVPIVMASDHFMIGWGQVETSPPVRLFVDTGLAGAGVKLARSAIDQNGLKLEEDKATYGAGGAGELKTVPYVVRQLSFGGVHQANVPGLYDGPFPWENTFGFHLAGMVGHDFFKRYAVTFDFQHMRVFIQ